MTIYKKILGCLITLTLIATGIHYMNFLVRPTNIDTVVSQIEAFHALPENSVEVIVYGSSHAFLGLDPITMYDHFGIGAYNYGWNWQQLNTSHLFLKDSLLKQTPKIALIEAFFTCTVLEDTDMTAEIYYTRYLHEKQGRKEYLKQCFGNDLERWLSDYMPLCAFHDNWNNLTKESFLPIIKDDRYEQNMGFLPIDSVTPITVPDPETFPQIPLGASSIAELDEIMELCSKKGIQVVFYTAPYGLPYGFCDAMKEYARQNDCVYLDLFERMDEVGLNEETDFADIGHLNTNGAVKVANYLGEFLVNHYELTDMREIEGNPWEIYSRQ